MRRTERHAGHPGTVISLFGAAPVGVPASERQHDPCERPEPLRDLCARAGRLLSAVRTLAWESRHGRGLAVDRIDEVARQLGALQSTFAAVAGTELRLAQVAQLGGARRDIADALVLTLELLERAR